MALATERSFIQNCKQNQLESNIYTGQLLEKKLFPVAPRSRLISAGLKPVISHISPWPLVADKPGFNFTLFHFDNYLNN